MDRKDREMNEHERKIMQYLGGDHSNMFEWTRMANEICGADAVQRACEEFIEAEAEYGEEDPYEGNVDVGELILDEDVPYCWKWFDKLG